MTGKSHGIREESRAVALQPILTASAVFMVLVWLSVFKQAMRIPLSHDENQFIAAGRLAAGGLLPYRDFPSNHMPYLTFAYGAIFNLTNLSLMPARAVSAVSAALAVGLVFSMAGDFFRDKRKSTRFMISGTVGLLLITNPVFRYTSGRAWNHDLPALLTLIAVALFLRSKSAAHPDRWILASGALVGLAVGTRLTYLLAVIPFLLTIILRRYEAGWRERRSQGMYFSAGIGLASLPWAALFAAAPRQFLFGNITYQSLNTDYRELLAHRVGETVLGKAIYFYHVLVDEPANLLLFLAFGILAALVVMKVTRRGVEAPEAMILLGSLAVVLLGSAFAGTPAWYQYFFAPIPFIILASACGLSFIWPASARWEQALVGGAAVVFLASGMAIVSQKDWNSLRDSNTWVPVQAHKLGIQVEEMVGEGKVLTLAPIFPLEGGLRIYESLATGPFSWRVAPILTEMQRREFGLLSYADLETVLQGDPPDAILVGLEAGNEGFEPGSKGGLEDPLDDYARQHGYLPVIMTTQLTEHEVRLWLR